MRASEEPQKAPHTAAALDARGFKDLLAEDFRRLSEGPLQV
jgi:hypothetical protein